LYIVQGFFYNNYFFNCSNYGAMIFLYIFIA